MKTNYRTITLLATMAAAGMLHAQEPAAKPAASAPTKINEPVKIDFAAVDKDANGQLTREEAVAVTELDTAFESLDANSDKSITPVEFAKWPLAGKAAAIPRDATTAPGGSAGAQHMPNTN